jgi:hypothetical protein
MRFPIFGSAAIAVLIVLAGCVTAAPTPAPIARNTDIAVAERSCALMSQTFYVSGRHC